MKKFFILIMATYLSVSLMAQPAAKRLLVPHGKLSALNSGTWLNHHLNGNIGRALPLAPHSIPVTEGFKSNLVLKQRLDSTLNQYYDSESGNWITYYKQSFFYNQNNENTLTYSFEPDNESTGWLVDSIKNEYTYNTDLNITENLWLKFNPVSTQWEPYSKDTYTYNASGKILQYITYSWDIDAGDWVLDYRDDYTYDAGTGLATQLLEYSTLDNAAVAEYKDEFKYDTDGNLSEDIWYTWNPETSTWEPEYKSEYQYDPSISRDEIIMPHLDYEFNHKLTKMINSEWASGSSSWNQMDQLVCYYSDLTNTGLVSKQQENLEVFPNPATDIVHFNTGSGNHPSLIELYNAAGRKVLSQELDFNRQLPVNELKNGLYFYTLTRNNRILKGKILISHD